MKILRALRRMSSFLGTIGLLASVVQAQTRTIPWRACLDQEPAWYAGDEAVRIADNVLLYQGRHGGWPKNIDMAAPLSEADRNRLAKPEREPDDTIDNGATYTQLRFLARVYAAAGHERFRAAFERGLDYLFEAQYPNGGWPQFYPLRDNYSRHITYNDHAMIGVMRLLRDVARARPPFAFVDPERRRRAAAAIEKGLEIILETQIVVDGRRTAWCAQHDAVTFEPRGARTYELPSLSGNESAGIVLYLMELEDPSPAVVEAVRAVVAWFEEARLTGIRVEHRPDASAPRGYDKVVVEDPAAPPMWARFYEIGTNRPIFCSRDGVPRAHLADISYERRNGYAWLGYWGQEVLDRWSDVEGRWSR